MFRSLPILAILAVHSFAATAYLEPKHLGELLGYPPDKIRATDWTETAKKKTPNVISSFLYEGEGRTFARVAVVVARYKSLLSESHESEIQQAITKAKEGNLPSGIARVEFAGGGYGYTGLDVFGPGGSQYSVLGSLNDAKIDFRVTVTIPSEPPLEILQGSGSYYDLLDGSKLSQKILEISYSVIANYANGNAIKISESGNPPKLGTPEAIILEASREAKTPEAFENNRNTSPPPKGKSFWFWVFLSLAGICLMVGVVVFTRKKSSSN
jgi:hypothetical protein